MIEHNGMSQETWSLIESTRKEFAEKQARELQIARQKYLENKKRYREENREKIRQSRKEYKGRPESKAIKNARRRWRYANESFYKERRNYRNYVIEPFRVFIRTGGLKRTKVTRFGYTMKQLKEHLESKWQEGMIWDNYSANGWHIDHIKPQCSFDFSKQEEIEKCWALSNLRPLWKQDNLLKGKKYEI